jgi:hypothetical protein
MEAMDLITPEIDDEFLNLILGDASLPPIEEDASKKRAASEVKDESEAMDTDSSRRSATPEPARKKKKIDPVRLNIY